MTAVAALMLAAVLLIAPPRRPRLPTTKPARSAQRDRADAGPDRPLAVAATLDLLAACLAAGLATETAIRAAAHASGAPEAAAALSRAADLIGLGAPPAQVWAAAHEVPGLAGLARDAARSARSGSTLAERARDGAAELRRVQEQRARAAGERSQVAVAGPLGLCFLPAFVLIGIGPTVIGLAGDLLGGGLG